MKRGWSLHSLKLTRNLGTVQPCDTSDVTQMLYELGFCAGYDDAFISSHSFNVGYANRTAVRVYAHGGSEQEIVDQLSGPLTWISGSTGRRLGEAGSPLVP